MCSELVRLLTIRNSMSHRGVVREGLLAARNTILKKDGLLAALVIKNGATGIFKEEQKVG